MSSTVVSSPPPLYAGFLRTTVQKHAEASGVAIIPFLISYLFSGRREPCHVFDVELFITGLIIELGDWVLERAIVAPRSPMGFGVSIEKSNDERRHRNRVINLPLVNRHRVNQASIRGQRARN
jgi:hypothetical protein